MAYQRLPLSAPLDEVRVLEIGERAAILEKVENSVSVSRFWWAFSWWAA